MTDEEVALSTLVDKLNERFGTDFTEADQLFFDQIRASAEEDEKIVGSSQGQQPRQLLRPISNACSMNCSSTAWKATKRSSPA